MNEFEFGDVIGWGRAPARGPVATLERPAGPAAGTVRAFVAALAARDFGRVRRSMAPEVRMRALLADGVCEASGPAAVTAEFRRWFGGFAELDLIDSRVDGIGGRIHVGWRLRARTTGGSRLLVAQHAQIEATDRIRRIDLLCSGSRMEERS